MLERMSESLIVLRNMNEARAKGDREKARDYETRLARIDAQGPSDGRHRPARCHAFLAMVRRQPCCQCGRLVGSEAAHFGKRGTATKASDFDTVPLCRVCHRHELHRTGTLPGLTSEQTREKLEEVNAVLLQWWVSLHDERVF